MNDLIKRDELFVAKVAHESKVIAIYNKVLKRVHNRIKHTANLNQGRTECVFVVPDFMLGIPTYNIKDCIIYVITALCKNGFNVNYTHPNLLHISWKHWEKDYEISKSVITGNQNRLIQENNLKQLQIQQQNKRREDERRRIMVEQIKQQEAASLQNQDFKRLKVQRGENPSLVRDINLVKQNRDDFTKSIETGTTQNTGGFYELDQIKKIQFLMQNK